MSGDDAKLLWTTYNNDLAELVKSNPDRYSGLASIPTSDISWAASELDRAHSQLGLIGATIPVGAFQSAVSVALLDPILTVAQQNKSHIYVQTGPASSALPGQWTPKFDSDDAPQLRATLETSATHAQAAKTLLQSGALDKYPDVTFQIALLGGLSSFALKQSVRRVPGAASASTTKGYGRILFDTGVYGASPELVAFAVGQIGASNVLFGSSYPTGNIATTVTTLQEAGFGGSDLQSIFVANGQAVLANAEKSA